MVIIAIYLVFSCIASISPTRIYQYFMRLLFNLPFIRKTIIAQLDEAREAILHEYPDQLRPKIDKIPYKPPTEIIGDASDK